MSNYATIVDLQAFKVAGNILDLGGYTDSELQENLDIAETIVESYVNTLFYEIDKVVYFDGNGNQTLFISHILTYPIISASACTEVDENDEVLHTFEEGPDFVIQSWYIAKTWSRGSTRLTIGSSGPTWPKGFRNIKVTGTFGYSEVPVEVKRATLLLAAEGSLPGSTGLAVNNIAEQRWDDYQVKYKGASQVQPSPSDSTGFEYIDRLLDKWRFKPDLFLTPQIHAPVFDQPFMNIVRSSTYPLS